jgi:YD repeat-containing protein
VLPDAFEFRTDQHAALDVELYLPEVLGFGVPATITVEYGNTGDVALPAPMLALDVSGGGSHDAVLTLDPSSRARGIWATPEWPDGCSNGLQFLAGGETPGVLQPGERVRLPVYWLGWKGETVSRFDFLLSVVTADDPRPIDWAALREETRPTTMTDQAWDTLWLNMEANVGTTWGDYVTMLDENASYLAELGQTVTDIGELWDFEIRQAYGYQQLALMEDLTDPRLQTPGIPLTFQRYFSGCILGRNEVTTLGRGWYHTWDTHLEVEFDNTVVIWGPRGFWRRFQPDSRGGYFADPGDEATLISGPGGTFTLREPEGGIQHFRVDGKLDYVQDPMGNRITCNYFGNRLMGLTHSSGQWLLIGYNPQGFIATVTETLTGAPDRVTQFTYDGDYLTGVTMPDGQTFQYVYETAGNPQQMHAMLEEHRPHGARYYRYDAAGRLSSISREGDAVPVLFSYDAPGKVTKTFADGGTIDYFYDHRALLVATRDALGNTTYHTYDNENRPIGTTDAAGHSTAFFYDPSGNLVQIDDRLGNARSFGYAGVNNRLTTSADANGSVTEYEYDAAGNLTSITYPDGSTEALARDAVGNLDVYTDREGRSIDYTYDAAGRVSAVLYEDGTLHELHYDARGNLDWFSDEHGTTTLEYNSHADHLPLEPLPGVHLRLLGAPDPGARPRRLRIELRL